MHARYYKPLLARFLSPDPVTGRASDSQSWNRYTYARDNPLAFIDPTGKVWILAGTAALQHQVTAMVNADLFGEEIQISTTGNVTIRSNDVVGPPTTEQAAFASQIRAAINQPQIVRQTLSSGSRTPIGLHSTGDMDVLDLAQLSPIPTDPHSAVGAIAHELAEQNVKQTAFAEHRLDRMHHEVGHPIALAAQAAATGWTPIPAEGLVESYQKGAVVRTFIYVFENGNLIKVVER